jgi:hypothetical protein
VQRSYEADRLGCTCICFLIRLRIAFWRRFALSHGLVNISILDLVLPGKMDTRPGFCTPLQLIVLVMVGDEIFRLETAYRESHAGSAYLGKLPSVPRFQDTKPTNMAHAGLVDWWIGGLVDWMPSQGPALPALVPASRSCWVLDLERRSLGLWDHLTHRSDAQRSHLCVWGSKQANLIWLVCVLLSFHTDAGGVSNLYGRPVSPTKESRRVFPSCDRDDMSRSSFRVIFPH